MHSVMHHAKSGIGFAQCHPSVARAVKAGRLGAIPLAFELGACDIGEAELESGERVRITWGRNLSPHSQRWHAISTSCRMVWVGADDGSCEIILPDTMDYTTLV